MKALSYRVTLKEPAILTAIEGEPNSSVSYDFIPGSVIRGYFISEAMKHVAPAEFDPTNDTISRLFFSNLTRYLNLYPVINDRRSLPVPASWRKKKYGDDAVGYDDAVRAGEPSTTEKLSSISGFADYIPMSQSENIGHAAIYKPERVINVHTQRARRSPDEQLVYRYDALAADQTFEGLILCAADDDAAVLYELMSHKQQIHIGGARNAGYGLALIEPTLHSIHDEWREVNHRLDSTIILTLLSDVILRDEQGQYAPNYNGLTQALERHGISFDCDYVALQTTLVGGFNRKWGLPLPQTPALKRGSVLRLVNVSYDEAKLVDLVWNGIGERRNEGFGQIALNWQQTATISLVNDKTKQSALSLQPTADGNAMWHSFQKRITASLITAEVIQRLFTDTHYKITGDISPSQLSRLRVKIAEEFRKTTPSLISIRDHLDDISGKKDAARSGINRKPKAAGKQFERARIGGVPLLEWLYEPQFNFENSSLNEPGYKLQLIDTVLERAQKERSSKQRARV